MSNYLDNEIMDAPKLVVVRVVDIHEIVQSDEIGFVVDVENAGLDVLDVTAVVTHQFSVDDYLKGFQLMQSGQCGKVILNW